MCGRIGCASTGPFLHSRLSRCGPCCHWWWWSQTFARTKPHRCDPRGPANTKHNNLSEKVQNLASWGTYPSRCCWPDPKCIVIRSAEYFIIGKLEASNDVVVVTLEHFGWTDWLATPVHLNAVLSEESSLRLICVNFLIQWKLFICYLPSGWGRLQYCAVRRSTGWSRTKWTTLCSFRRTARTACSNRQRGKQREGCGGSGFLSRWWCLKTTELIISQ
jgi:hypothetical protein